MIDTTHDKLNYLKKTPQASESRENFDARQQQQQQQQYYYNRENMETNQYHFSQFLGTDNSLLSSSSNNSMSREFAGASNDISMINLADSKSSFSLSGSSSSNRFNAYQPSLANSHLISSARGYHMEHADPHNLFNTESQGSQDNLRLSSQQQEAQQAEGELFHMIQKVGRQQLGGWNQQLPDMSEFPALTSHMNKMALYNKSQNPNDEKKSSTEKRVTDPDFMLESEFPALGVTHTQAQVPTQMQTMVKNAKDFSSVTATRGAGNNSLQDVNNSRFGSVMSGKNHGSHGGREPTPDLDVAKSIPSLSSKDRSSIAWEGKEQDKYGLLGLLQVIQGTKKDITTLAIGMDLTSLGLNLNSTEPLYATFASPWSDTPAVDDPHYTLPLCYFNQSPVLKMSHLSKFHLETLFYVFYSLPRDILQLAAAQELYLREWRYHSEHKLWFKQANPSDGILLPPSSNSNVRYIYLDLSSWERRLYTGNTDLIKGFLPEEEIRTRFRATTNLQPAVGTGAVTGGNGNKTAT